MNVKEGSRKPSFIVSLFLTASLVIILTIGILKLDIDLHVLLILILTYVSIVSYMLGYSYDEIIDGMRSGIDNVMPAMMIFILIGVIISAWIYSGTVPAIIYYGLKYINPKYFLPLGLLICSLTSMAIGTSWGTAGTIGIALMGMSVGLNIPKEITAGMIISGAYFGDKMSPISDTTNLSAASAGADLYDHIRTMSYTTIPSYIIVLILYTLLGFKYTNKTIDTTEIKLITDTLAGNFVLSPIVFLPMIILFTLNMKKMPAVPAMLIGAVSGVLVAIFVQKAPVLSVIDSINYGYEGYTGVELVDNLLNRGGIQSMMWTFSLAFIAISLGGVLEKVGYLDVLISGFIGRIKNQGLLALVVILTTTLGNMAMGEVYLSIILNGNLYKEEFKRRGLCPSMLSRYLEEGGTLTEAFIPWTTGAAFMATTLGVKTIEYAPYAFLNYINPLLSIIFSFLGIFVIKEKASIDKEIKDIKI